MAGHTPWEAIQARRGPITPERQVARDAYRRAMAEARRIARAREAGAARVEIADLPGSDLGARRDDLYLAALREYVEELGGRLVLVATFPEGATEQQRDPAPVVAGRPGDPDGE